MFTGPPMPDVAAGIADGRYRVDESITPAIAEDLDGRTAAAIGGLRTHPLDRVPHRGVLGGTAEGDVHPREAQISPAQELG